MASPGLDSAKAGLNSGNSSLNPSSRTCCTPLDFCGHYHQRGRKTERGIVFAIRYILSKGKRDATAPESWKKARYGGGVLSELIPEELLEVRLFIPDDARINDY